MNKINGKNLYSKTAKSAKIIVNRYEQVKSFLKKMIYPFYPMAMYAFIQGIFAILCLFSASSLSESTFFAEKQMSWFIFNTFANIVCIIYFGIWYFLRFYLKKEERSTFGYLPLNKKSIFAITSFFICFNLLVDEMWIILSKHIPQATSTYHSVWDAPSLLVSACLIVPITEELLFRGIIFNIARALKTPFLYSNIVQALFFTFMHEGIYKKIYGFIFAFILGYIYEKHGRLWLTLLLHSGFNIWSLIISKYTATFPLWSAIILSIFSIGILLYLLKAEIDKERQTHEIEEKKKEIITELIENTKTKRRTSNE